MGAYASAEANAKRRREDPRKSRNAVPAQGGRTRKSTSSSHHRSSKKTSTSKSNGRQPSPADAQRSRSKSHSPEKTGGQKSTPHIPSSSRTTPTPPPPPQKASKGRSCPAHHHKSHNVDRGFTGEYFLLQSGNQLKTSEPVERTGAASAPLTAYEREGYAATPPEACGGNTRTPSSPEDGHFPLQRKEVLPFTSFRGMVAQAHSQAVAEDRRVTVKPERRGRRKNKNDQTKGDERDYNNNNNAFRPPLSPPLQARAASNILSGCASLTEYSFFGYLSNESVERPARRPTTANSRGHNTNTYPFTSDNRDDESDEDEEDEGDAESEFEIRAPSSASESSSVSTIATQSDVTMHSNHTASTTAEAAATATRGLAVAYSYFNISKAQKAKAQRRAEDDDVSADARSRLARKGTFGMRMPAGRSVVFHQGIQDSFQQPPSRRSSVALEGGDNGSAYDDFLDTFLLSDRNSIDGLRPAATCIVDENNNNNNDMTHPDNFLYSVDSHRRVDSNTDNSNNRRRPSPSSAKPAPPPPQLVGTVTSTAARRPYRLPQPIMHGAPSMQTRSRPFDVERVLDFPLRSIVRIPSPDWRALGMHEDMPNYQSSHSPMNSPCPLQTVQQHQARRRGPFGFNVPRSF